VYCNYEPLIALAAAAAVTERIGMMTDVSDRAQPEQRRTAREADRERRCAFGGPSRAGVGLGGRRDDYAAGGVPPVGRGKWLEAMLDEMKRIRAG
jgi:alkanesulfonate monooxygenase SsuD/methylene tetrahydromethanopterin reductase-like flavin-dependent oxidoreductase (luciferase family)